MKKLSDFVVEDGKGHLDISKLNVDVEQILAGEFLLKQSREGDINIALELGKRILQCRQIVKMLVDKADDLDPFFLRLFNLKVIFDNAFGIVVDIEKQEPNEKITFKG